MFKRNSRAVSVTEYTLLLGTVFLAITAMNFYLKRGVQARVKDLTVNLIVKDLYPLGQHQYVAGNAQSDATTKMVSSQSRRTRGSITEVEVIDESTITGNETSVAQGWEDILP